MNVMEPIRHCLGNLVTFSGRDSRTTFWFYVLFLVVVYFAISLAVGVFAGGAMAVDMVRNVSKHAGPDEAAIMASMKTRMISTMRLSFWVNAVMSLIIAALLVAAFVRRLHDSGKPGWIAAIAVAFKLVAVAASVGTIQKMSAALQTLDFNHPETFQAQMQAQQAPLLALISLVPLLIVVVFGCMGSADGDNRFGPEPDDY